MKRKLYILISIVSVIFVMLGCYEDKSSLNYKLMNPITIDNGGENTSYKVFAFNKLTIKPIVYREGIEDKDLSYDWTISGNNIVPKSIGHNMTLDTIIDVNPESNSYKLLFSVTDNTTSISVDQTYEVSVRSAFGSGLIVCDTRDEKTSDVSLVMAYNFTGGMKVENDTIMSDLFSRVNKRKIDGVATSVTSSIYGTNRSLTIGTDHTIDRVDPFNYTYIDGDGDAFIIDPGVYNVTTLVFPSNVGNELMAIGGKIYPRFMQQNNKRYSYYLLTNDLSDYSIKKFCRPTWEDGIGFDELNGRFLEFDGASKLMILKKSRWDGEELAFDPNELKDFTCLTIFSGYNSRLYSILKNKETEGIYVYETLRAYPWGDDKVNNGKPMRILNLSDCPDIKNASFFDSSEKQAVIYYATENKIYSVNFTSGLITKVEYEAPEGETITSMMLWKSYQGMVDYANPDPEAEEDDKINHTSTSNRMIVLTTYNSAKKEGVVRTMAISNLGWGTLEKDTKLHGKFDGFGRITAINIQKAF